MEISVPEYSRDNDRGQVGIETLIVFIAMILVAAIAASVLINTAGYLQNQASETSQDSEDQVSNQVLIISSIGEIDAGEDYSIVVEYDDTNDQLVLNDPWFDELIVEYDEGNNGEIDEVLTWEADGQGDILDVAELEVADGDSLTVGSSDIDYDDSSLDAEPAELSDTLATDGDTGVAQVRVEGEHNSIGEISMTVMQSPGADEIDLEGASVEYIGPDGQETLIYDGTAANAADSDFTVEAVRDDGDTAPVLTTRDDRMSIIIDLDYEYALAGDSDLRNLEEGEDATVRIVTQAGSEAVTILNAPQSLSSYDDGDAVEL